MYNFVISKEIQLNSLRMDLGNSIVLQQLNIDKIIPLKGLTESIFILCHTHSLNLFIPEYECHIRIYTDQ